MKLTGICLVTKNVPVLADFYKKVLRDEAQGDEQHMEIKTNGAGLAIFSVQGMEAMAPHSTCNMGHGSITVMFEVEEVDKEYERLAGLGVEMIKPPQTYPWGARSFWFKDPDGNIVDFYTLVNS